MPKRIFQRWLILALPVLALSALPARTAMAGEARALEARVEVGIGHVSDDAFRFGRYTGLVDEGPAGWLNFAATSQPDWNSDDTRYWSVAGEHLGRETTVLQAEAGDHGKRALSLRYSEIPHYFFEDGQTPFRLLGDNTWTLPGDWQVSGDTTDTIPDLSAQLAPVAIKHRRERLDLDYQQQLPAAWDFTASYRHESKEGSRPLGAVIGSTGGNARAAILPTRLDFTTHIMELGLNYLATDFTLGVNYYGSFFRNQNDQVTWQNPFGPQAQWAAGVAFPAGLGRLALEPDNSAHRLSVAGSYVFSPLTRASVELGYGKLVQDDDFLPYTINPALSAPIPLPRGSLDGEIETLTADLRLSTRPTAAIHLIARYRLDDRDNNTPRFLLLPVPGDAVDQVPAEEGVLNRPYSYRRQSLTVDADYRASRRVRIDAGYHIVRTDRTFSEINQSHEYTASLGATLRAFHNASLQLSYHYAERDGERYIGNRPLIQAHPPGTIAPDAFENHPLLRKYYLADRQRDRLRFRADWFAGPQLSLGFNTDYNRDDYPDAFFGLNQVTLTTYTIDATYLAGEHLHLTGFLTIDRYQQDQTGRSFTAAPSQITDPNRNWGVDTADRFTTINLSAEYSRLQQQLAWLRERGLRGDLGVGIELNSSRSTGDVDVATGPALASAPLPELETHLRFYRLYADYQLSTNSTASLSFTHERYDSDDFRLDGVDPATIERVLSLGESSQDYSVNWIWLGFRYRFW